MPDIFDPEKRSEVMSKIRSKNTKPELYVRSLLHRAGFRFRLTSKAVPGKPDIVLPKWRAVILVHGCFWHGHDCPRFSWPATRGEFWRAKILENKKRDAAYLRTLKAAGWRVCVVWECALKGKGRIDAVDLSESLKKWILSDGRFKQFRGRKRPFI